MVAQERPAPASWVEAMTHFVHAIDFAWCKNSRNSEIARSIVSAKSALRRWLRLRIWAASALESGVKAPLGHILAILIRTFRTALLSRILATLGVHEIESGSGSTRSHANFRNLGVNVDTESGSSIFGVRGFVQGYAESRRDLDSMRLLTWTDEQ
jgi:hypothetical protein